MGLREPDEIKMTWTEITRAQYQRDDLNYASDLRDAQWALIAPLMSRKKRLGKPQRTDFAPGHGGGNPLYRRGRSASCRHTGLRRRSARSGLNQVFVALVSPSDQW